MGPSSESVEKILASKPVKETDIIHLIKKSLKKPMSIKP
jgi:hypothetical protein